jgi:hypothetical protein
MNQNENRLPPIVIRAVLKWVDFYTQFVPHETAMNRREEIRSDIFEQQTAGSSGTSSPRVVNSRIFIRATRGIIADISWCGANFAGRRRVSRVSSEVKDVRAVNRDNLAVALWLTLLAVAVLGIAASVTELIEYGGRRLGYVPWPGADTINVALVILVSSAGIGVIAVFRAAVKILQRQARR